MGQTDGRIALFQDAPPRGLGHNNNNNLSCYPLGSHSCSEASTFVSLVRRAGGSVAEWLACWTQAQKGPGSNRSRDAVVNSLRQTVHTHCASVHQAAKLVAALFRVAGVTAVLAESNGSLPSGL